VILDRERERERESERESESESESESERLIDCLLACDSRESLASCTLWRAMCTTTESCPVRLLVVCVLLFVFRDLQ